ncbi:MAG: Threonine--tRNA ligase [Candidatus Methanogaster sp.]|nr:MAG: Threonine--tRNA ligase [ANME-2 cluster archaeon]
MQLLLIHSDYIEYKTKKRTPVAEEIDPSGKSGRMEEALTVFVAVESYDEADPIATAENAADEIKKLAGQVKTERIMLYPYAHLSSELAKPLVAVDVLKKLEENLPCDYEVKRAPFGWYKAFTVSCKGHPLSELSRTIRVGTEERGAKGVGKEEVRVEVVSEALKSEEKAISHWHVLTLEGELLPIEDFDFKDHPNLLSFADYETSKSRAVDKIPPHVELMRRLELADYEPGSDSGNMRFYPKGTLVKRLLEAHVLDTVGGTGAVEVETPVMYDVNHPTLKKYLDRFPARQYSIESDKRSFFLRFAACFGQFLMNHDMTISHRNLPLKMVEMTRYSFRREQHGELVGLRRLRAFTMPDMHTLCADMDHAIDEFKDQYTMCMKMLADIGLDDDYEVAIRFTRDFYRENQDFIKELVGIVGKPALIELWDSRFFYFVIKFEFNYIDALKKASALSTVQIDVENAERYDITYIDKNGTEQRPTILHCSPSGAIERCIYALLEKAHLTSKAGGVPSLPTWLSPTQVRLIPVAERHLGYAEEVAAAINGVRADIDDRDETVGKRVRVAGREWVPYVVVIGDKEVESGVLSVTIRAESGKVEETARELQERVLAEIAGMPYRQINLPVLLSKRPIFFG